MNERQMFEKSFERPSNFFDLPHEERWALDKQLGILDWEGDGLSEEDQARYQAHYKSEMKLVPMPLPNTETHPHLATVSEVWEVNKQYVVMIAKTGIYDHIRIRRKDNKAMTDYKIFQDIKNKFLGEEKVAVQIFPKVSNYVDNTNTYHVFSWEGIEVPNLKELYTYKL